MPSWHFAHVVKPLDVLNVPDGHFEHMEEPENLANVPSTHSKHTAEELDPPLLTYLPAEHNWHVVWAFQAI